MIKGYVQLRRGIADHFKVMSSSELKVYVGLLILADYKNGSVNITLAKLADFIALSYKMTQICVHRLEAFGYVKFTQAKNQWQDNKIEIIKYSACNLLQKPSDDASVKYTEPIAEAVAEATTTANAVSSNNDNELQNPNKYKEDKRNTIVVRDYFFSSYKQVFNKDYVANFGKDGDIFKGLLAVIPLEELKILINKFFESEDTFIKKSGYTTGVFKSVINKLRQPVIKQPEGAAGRELEKP